MRSSMSNVHFIRKARWRDELSSLCYQKTVTQYRNAFKSISSIYHLLNRQPVLLVLLLLLLVKVLEIIFLDRTFQKQSASQRQRNKTDKSYIIIFKRNIKFKFKMYCKTYWSVKTEQNRSDVITSLGSGLKHGSCILYSLELINIFLVHVSIKAVMRWRRVKSLCVFTS